MVAGKTAGAQFGYLRIFDLKADFPGSPAIGVANLAKAPRKMPDDRFSFCGDAAQALIIPCCGVCPKANT